MSQTWIPGEAVFPIKTLRKYPNGTLNPESERIPLVVVDNGMVMGKIDLEKVVGQGRATYEEGTEEWSLHMKWLETPMGKLFKHMFENGSGIDFEITPVGIGTVENNVVRPDYKLLGFSLVASVQFNK